MSRLIEEIEILNLVDNNVKDARLLGEAGYCALVKVNYDDSSRFTFLFDASSSRTALTLNTGTLEEDLTTVSIIVLSHGHWDHIGGLLEAISLTDKKPVLCHPDALHPKTYNSDDGKTHKIGIQKFFSESKLKSKTEVITTREPYTLADGIQTTGEVPRTNSFEKLTGMLQKITRDQEGKEIRDDLSDDMSVIFQMKDGSVVILTGCCHSGIVNTIDHAVKLTGSSSVVGIVGGLHLFDASKERLSKTIDHLKKYPLATLGPCHCTGLKGRAALMYAFEDQFKDIGAGSVIKFTST